MSEHTPGPWDIAALIREYGIFPNDGSSVVTGADRHIANVTPQADFKRGKGHEHRNDPERDANARLIAAAPDLLAAILNSDDAHWTPNMRAAVAKATGEQP